MWTYNNPTTSDELMHYGVLGMKWGKRKARGGAVQTMRTGARNMKKVASSIGNKPKRSSRNRVDNDHKNLSDQEFMNKYSVSKDRYAKRRDKMDRKDAKVEARNEAKRQANAPNKKYSNSDRMTDNIVYGKKGVDRINKRMNKGDSYSTARNKEMGRQFAAGVLMAGAAISLSDTGFAKRKGRKGVEMFLKATGHRNITWLD